MIRIGVIVSFTLAAACGSGKGTGPGPSEPAEPTTEETASEDMTPTATEPTGYQYSEEAKAEFLDGCLEESDPAVCDCLLVQVQQRYSEQYLDENGMEGLSPEEIEAIVAPCRPD